MIRQSSLTKKFIMAFVGLFLGSFLLIHLAINLFILPLTDNHVEIFEKAVHFMTTNPVIKVFEIVLFGGFIIHIIYGLTLQIQNWSARPKKYKKEGWSQGSFFSKFMIHTGLLIFIFLVIHLGNFYFVKLGFSEPVPGSEVLANSHDFYLMAINLFSNTGFAIFYIVMFLFLGFHLNHAIQSAFQTLGLNHSKYTPFIKAVGTIYSIVVTLGFLAIPLYFIIT